MNGVMDFTEGKSTKMILKFFFPMLATNMLQQFYSFADAAIVGNGLGSDSLAAVGNMSSLMFLVVGFAMGLSNGFCVLIAQNFGEKDYKKLRRTLMASIQLAVVFAILLTVISMTYLPLVLVLLQTDPSIMKESMVYGSIILGGLSATIAYNMCAGVLRSLGDSKTPLIAIVVSSILNIAMDSLLILVLKMGVEGAAIATILSQVVSAGICFRKLRRIAFLKLSKADAPVRDFRLYFDLLKNGTPMALMNSITAVGCMVVQYFVNGLGVAYTSAYTACVKYINMFMQPACTAGYTMSAFTGQNYGAKQFDRILKGLFVCLMIALSAYLLLGTGLVLFPRFLAGLLLDKEEPIRLAMQFLPVCGVMLFAVDFLFVFRSAVQGMGFPLVPMVSGIAEMVLRIYVIIEYLPEMGFRATSYAEACAWTGALLINIVAFVSMWLLERNRYNLRARPLAETKL